MTIESKTATYLSALAILAILVIAIILASKSNEVEKLASVAFSAIGTIVGFTAGHHLGSSGKSKSDKRASRAMVLLNEAGVEATKISSLLQD